MDDGDHSRSQMFSQKIRKVPEPGSCQPTDSVGDGMSQQGTGQREANQTKDLKHVNKKTHKGPTGAVLPS